MQTTTTTVAKTLEKVLRFYFTVRLGFVPIVTVRELEKGKYTLEYSRGIHATIPLTLSRLGVGIDYENITGKLVITINDNAIKIIVAENNRHNDIRNLIKANML